MHSANTMSEQHSGTFLCKELLKSRYPQVLDMNGFYFPNTLLKIGSFYVSVLPIF